MASGRGDAGELTLFQKAIRRLRRAWWGSRYTCDKWTRAERLEYLEQAVGYLMWESSRQSSVLRHLAAPVLADLPAIRRTKASFDYQWAEIPGGAAMLDAPEFRAQATRLVTQFTGLPAEWFRGKRVIDAGCGNGRFSWALCELGAEVLSLDQSAHGLRQTAEACHGFPAHRTMQVDLLKPLPVMDAVDLVWSFGVLHHTGDTYRAFRNLVPLVKPGGYLYMMIYGEPRPHLVDDLFEINEYGSWRHRTMNFSLPEKLAAIRGGMEAGQFRTVGEAAINGYFDAISPPINDLYTFEELESWLIDAGFCEIVRTVDARNHHVIGRRVVGGPAAAAP